MKVIDNAASDSTADFLGDEIRGSLGKSPFESGLDCLSLVPERVDDIFPSHQ